MDCEKHQNLIKKYISGIISDPELNTLKIHIEDCSICRREFKTCTQIENIVTQSLSTQMTVEQARDSILSKLPHQSVLPARNIKFRSPVLFRKRMVVAASILLVSGLLFGFYIGRATTAIQTKMSMGVEIPIHITDIEGLVLMKHQNLDSWEILNQQSIIYAGDTFHSAGKSGFGFEFEDKSTINLSPHSMLILKLYNGGTEFYLERGELSASLESPHPLFVISTPHGEVEAIGTEFTISVE